MTNWKPKGMTIGVDVGRPGGDHTVVHIRGRTGGKRALLERMVEASLDAGHTVVVASFDGYEIRGADHARDVTPKQRRIP